MENEGRLKPKGALKILHVALRIPLHPNIGGLETYLRLVSKEQVRDCEVSIMGRTSYSSRMEEKKLDGVTYVILPMALNVGTFPTDVSNKLKLLASTIKIFVNVLTMLPTFVHTLRSKGIDVVIFYEFFFAPLALVSRLFGCPCCLGLFAFQPRWGRALPGKRGLSLKYLMWWTVLNCFSIVFTHNKVYWVTSKSFIDNLGMLTDFLGRGRVFYIPGGLNLSLYGTIEPELQIMKLKDRGNSIVICPRRLVPEKGVQYLAKAIPKVLEQYENVTFIFTGEGPLREHLAKEISLFGVADHVIFTGAVPYNAQLSYIKASDIVVVPSSGEEMFGMAILEAYALNKSVVATRFGGIPDVVDEGESGILVEPANPDQLAESIIDLLMRPDLRNKLSEGGYMLLKERFDLTKVVRKLMNVCYLLKERNVETC